jgi:hypothetical protein
VDAVSPWWNKVLLALFHGVVAFSGADDGACEVGALRIWRSSWSSRSRWLRFRSLPGGASLSRYCFEVAGLLLRGYSCCCGFAGRLVVGSSSCFPRWQASSSVSSGPRSRELGVCPRLMGIQRRLHLALRDECLLRLLPKPLRDGASSDLDGGSDGRSR